MFRYLRLFRENLYNIYDVSLIIINEINLTRGILTMKNSVWMIIVKVINY